MSRSGNSSNFWVAIAHMEARKKAFWFSICFFAYFAGLPFFFQFLGPAYRTTGFIFLIPAALFWGLKGGVLLAAFGLITGRSVHWVLGFEYAGGLVGPIFAICLTALIGYLRDLNLVLDEQLTRGRMANEELKRYRDNLEVLIAERTEELTRLATAINQTSETVMIMDTSGNLVYANPSFEKATGYTIEEALGKNVNLLLSGNYTPFFYPDIWDTVSRGELWTGPITNPRKDGHLYRGEATVTPVLDAAGEIMNIVAVSRDISRETYLENMLLQSQKMEAIGTLAGGIAHDFNNILAAVIGYTELSLHETAPGSVLHHQLEMVLGACSRATDLVKQILSFSRQNEFKPKPVRAVGIVRETLKLIRASLPATIQIDMKLESRAVIMADPTQIHQVVLNLCTNAGFSMRDREGVLEVGLYDVVLKPECIDDARKNLLPGNYVELVVRDTGHGIPEEIKERIFDPFFTTKSEGKGSGMGLSVVHGIVKSHSGAVTLESTRNVGTTFHVFIPSIEGDIIDERVENESIPGGHERILYVDDEHTLVELGRQMLENLGYYVDGFSSSTDAYHFFRRNAEKIDLVITDLTMPMMTGQVLAEKIMDIMPDIPIIICTGYSETFSEETAKRLGFKGFANKPIVLSELAAMVRSVLDLQKQPA